MISPDSLRNEKTISQYKSGNDRLHEQEREILKSWTDGNIKIALIGFENQTNPDKYMPVRIFSYEGADYRSQLGAAPIVPVVSLILYFGIVARYFSEKRKYKDYIPNDTRTIKHVDEVLKLLSVMIGDDRYEKILAFSNEKGQVRTMCDVAQRLEDKGRIEGRIEVLVTLVKSDSITIDAAAGVLKITTTEFKKYL